MLATFYQLVAQFVGRGRFQSTRTSCAQRLPVCGPEVAGAGHEPSTRSQLSPSQERWGVWASTAVSGRTVQRAVNADGKSDPSPPLLPVPGTRRSAGEGLVFRRKNPPSRGRG